MANRIKSLPAILRCSVALGAVLLPVSAFAQETPQEDEDVIVVTGSLIRGVEVTGSQQIGIDSEAITESGASTTSQLLGEIPQVGNFFNGRIDNDPRAADRLQVSRPNLRNLPGVNSATGATTLILVDGHRMTPMGVDQASFDPDFISPGSIERVEIVTDGGSSLYGADAVGGVINFITRKSFDGLEVTGGYDVGDSYTAWNAGVTAGTSWEGGNAFISYATYQRDNLLNSDRSYAARGQWNADGSVLSPSGTQCLNPVGAITTWANFGAGWTNNPLAASLGVKVTPVGSPCDIDNESSLLPQLERHSVLFGLSQEVTPNLSLTLKANFGDSQVTYSAYPLGDTISEPTPTELMLPGAFRDTYDVAAVGFSYGANGAYVDRDQTLNLRVFGVTPELTFDAGNGWQIKSTIHWGRSENSRVLPGSDRTKLAAYNRSGALDPTNIAAASGAVITDILNYETAGQADQELFLFRTVVDGGLFDLGDDTVRVAVGVEYNNDRVEGRFGQGTIGFLGSVPQTEFSRDVKSVFGEISIPLFSILDLSASGRYDDYSDFGSTFNPTFGASFAPIDGLRIYGHWGESFNAPTALDAIRTANARFIPNASAGVPDPLGERTATPTRNDVLLVEGSGGGLQPQTAQSWSVGFEFEPVDMVTFGGNYYDIDFRNLLSSVNPQLASEVLLNPTKFISNPTQAQFAAFLATTSNGTAQFGNINAADVGVIIDRRVANLNKAHIKGIDASMDVLIPASFGDLSFGVSGDKILSFDLTSGATTVDQLQFDNSDFRASAYAGLSTGGFRGKITVNRSGGFDTNIAVNQTHVGSFTVADLFLGYTFEEGSGALGGLSLRLNVDNLFDTDPPVYRQQRNLNFAGFTLGRIFKFGVSKKF